MKNLRDKTAFITGGANGIGLGIAEALVNQGMQVALRISTPKHSRMPRRTCPLQARGS